MLLCAALCMTPLYTFAESASDTQKQTQTATPSSSDEQTQVTTAL
jgi:hypothetical protein